MSDKHKHEWEPRLSMPTAGQPAKPYLYCRGCGKKRGPKAKRRRW